MRVRIRQIGRLGLCWHSSPPAPSPLSQVPFHPGLSVELQSGLRQEQSMPDWPGHSTVIPRQKKSPSGSLACFVLLSTHKNAHTHVKWATHTSRWPENGQCTHFFFSTTRSHKVHFDILVYFTFAGRCLDLCFGSISRSVQKAARRFFTLRCWSAVSNMTHHAMSMSTS